MHNSNKKPHISSSSSAKPASATGLRILVLDFERSEIRMGGGTDLSSSLLDNAIGFGTLGGVMIVCCGGFGELTLPLCFCVAVCCVGLCV